jgi:hypothetical protein
MSPINSRKEVIMKKTNAPSASRANRANRANRASSLIFPTMRTFTNAAHSVHSTLRRTQTLAALAPHMLTHPAVRKAYATLTRALARAYAVPAPTPVLDGDTPASTGFVSVSAIQPWLDVDQHAETVRIGVSLRDLESFKDPRLLKVLEAFVGTADADGAEWESSTADYAFTMPNRDYSFERKLSLADPTRLPPGLRKALSRAHDTLVTLNHWDPTTPSELKIIVNVYAYVKSDSPLCRVVVTGVTERVIREEKKEIVCE